MKFFFLHVLISEQNIMLHHFPCIIFGLTRFFSAYISNLWESDSITKELSSCHPLSRKRAIVFVLFVWTFLYKYFSWTAEIPRRFIPELPKEAPNPPLLGGGGGGYFGSGSFFFHHPRYFSFLFIRINIGEPVSILDDYRYAKFRFKIQKLCISNFLTMCFFWVPSLSADWQLLLRSNLYATWHGSLSPGD